jgi:transposase-like protein
MKKISRTANPDPLHNDMKNKPLSNYKKKKLIESFCDELTATQAAHRLNLDRNTVNKYFKRIRECIAGYREYQKMKLMITALSSSDVQIQAVSKRITASNAGEDGIPVRIMCISGQLLTDLEARTNGNPSKYMMNVSQYFDANGHQSPNGFNGHSLDCDNLGKLADDFHEFTTSRFKKFFGIKNEHAYLFVKEAEFVYNEKEYAQREKLLNQMTGKIFA